MTTEYAAKTAVRTLIKWIGDDPDREGLKNTPERVMNSYVEMFSGYLDSPAHIAEMLTTFEDGACDEMVLLKGIEFHSFCEHHILPFYGRMHIAYIPDGRVVGISKLVRLANAYAHRLQIQERLTQQVTDAIQTHLKPKGAACVVEAVHSCMRCRGVRNSSSTMVTSSLLGDFREGSVRAEFFSLIKG